MSEEPFKNRRRTAVHPDRRARPTTEPARAVVARAGLQHVTSWGAVSGPVIETAGPGRRYGRSAIQEGRRFSDTPKIAGSSGVLIRMSL